MLRSSRVNLQLHHNGTISDSKDLESHLRLTVSTQNEFCLLGPWGPRARLTICGEALGMRASEWSG